MKRRYLVNKYTFLFWLAVIALLGLIVNTILTKSVDNDRLPVNRVVLDRIEEIETRNNHSYNLWIINQDYYLKISADYSKCFDKSAFLRNIQNGDTLFIKYTEREGLFRKGTITSIYDGNIDYLDTNCINDKISKSKKRLPVLAGIGILIFLIIILWKFGVRINY